jgi:hypothetical protein
MGLFLLQVFLTALHFVLEFTIAFNRSEKQSSLNQAIAFRCELRWVSSTRRMREY